MVTMTELNVLLDYDLDNDLENQDDEELMNEFLEYDGDTYLCDAISEISDSAIGISNREILENAWGLYVSDAYENAASDGLMGDGKDLIKALQAAWFWYNENQLYNNLETLVFNYAVAYLNKQGLRLTDEGIESLQGDLSAIDNNSTFEDIIDIVEGDGIPF